MIKVDDRIKNLVAKYGVRRNFRVIFPNGERADLTNKDIIQDSVELVESVCSETVFRFGCCERSMISFECMGVENIQGCQIRCGLEIDTSSLSANDILWLQSMISLGRDDGELVLAADSDIGYGYYRIPYGKFWVESCPRDHSDRKRRRVTAYSADINKISPVERVRLATYSPGYDYYTAKPYYLAAVNAGYLLPDLYDAWSFNQNKGTNFNYYTWAQIQAAAASDSATFSVTEDGHTYSVTISGTYSLEDYSERMSGGGTGVLGEVRLSGWDTDAAWYAYQKFFADNGVSEPTVAAHTRLPRTYLQPHIGYDKEDQYGTYDHAPIYWMPDYGCPFFIQMYRAATYKANSFVRLMWDLTLTFTIDGVTQDTQTFFPVGDLSASIDQLYSNYYGFTWQYPLDFKATNKYEQNGVTYYSFVDSYTTDSANAGFLELNARQFRVDRRGLPMIIRLNNGSQTAISADKIESIWWEDAEISPIGEVDWQIADEASMDPNDTIFGTTYAGNDGKSIYKMLSNNYILQINYGNRQPPLSDFFEYLPQSEFIPFEAVIHDMPWMLPGDAIQLATKDTDVPTLNTIILTQRIKGVTSLRQEIGAQGGSVFFEDNAFVDGVAAIYGDQ